MTGPEVTAAMKAEDVDVARVRAKDERVPTTDEIRNWATYVPDTSVGMHVSERDAAAFDRWLSRHDSEIQAQALRDAAEALDLPGSTATGYYASEQHSGYEDAARDAEYWLRARAAHLTTTEEPTDV